MSLSASVLYKLTFLLIALGLLTGFISPFVPWIQKDIAPLLRAYFYPFWHCIENTTTTTNAYCCEDNDFSGPTGVSAGNPYCHDLIITAIAMDFIAVILSLLTLIPLGVLIFMLASRPMVLAVITTILPFIICAAAICAWVIWIVYAETVCAAGSVFPVQGYSYGFILVVFTSFLSMLACITCCMATIKLRRDGVPVNDDIEKDETKSTPSHTNYSFNYPPPPSPDTYGHEPNMEPIQYPVYTPDL